MKKVKIISVMGLMLLVLCSSCNKQELENDISSESKEDIRIQELRDQLVNSGPWVVKSYDVLDVKFSTSETISNEEINTHIIRTQLRGYTIDFAQDGTVMIEHPATGVHIRTWRILLGSVLIFNDSQVPQFWRNATVNEDSMSIDLDLYSVVKNHPAVVEHFGRLHFKSQSSQ